VGKKRENKSASRAETGEEDGAAEPVNKGFMPPFQGTRCAQDASAISYWTDHWLLTSLIDKPILPTDLHITSQSNECDVFTRTIVYSHPLFSSLFPRPKSLFTGYK